MGINLSTLKRQTKCSKLYQRNHSRTFTIALFALALLGTASATEATGEWPCSAAPIRMTQLEEAERQAKELELRLAMEMSSAQPAPADQGTSNQQEEEIPAEIVAKSRR